ncbi:MAG: flagellar protein FliS [Planctomycetales bacterium]|nr:flagellar protein FliS [Planctomycetales bacterium]
MSNPSKSHYLESKVLTASQPQLQVMLLDGALRFGRQAEKRWSDGAAFLEVDALLARMGDIVDELTHGVAQAETEFSLQLEEQYAFIYREIAACRINEDAEKLSTCLRLLDYHRETWKLACERVEAEPRTAKPMLPHMNTQTLQSSQGFSFEA